MPQRHLVLLDIGHTNAHIVKQWQSDPIPDCKLTCISKFPTATYSGMLPGTNAAAPPVLGKLGLETDDRGFIATTNTLQSISDSRIFAVGDSGTIVQSPSPKAGVYAVRQCPILWHNLRAFFDGGSMKTFDPQSGFLKLLNTGDGKALLQYGVINAHARWCWHLKTWIDKRFITPFQNSS